MNVIAHLFRDIGQTDTGLTAAVEEVAGAVMRRMAKLEQPIPTHGTGNKNRQSTEIGLSGTNAVVLYAMERSAPEKVSAIALRLNLPTDIVRKAIERLENRGVVDRDRPGPGTPALYWITDSGHEAIKSGILPVVTTAHKVAAE